MRSYFKILTNKKKNLLFSKEVTAMLNKLMKE